MLLGSLFQCLASLSHRPSSTSSSSKFCFILVFCVFFSTKDGTDGSNLADFIELSNGCVCCTVKDSLVETLENLLAKRIDLDYVIIEASGMADPGPVASIFWLDKALESRIRLDGIVTCVDARNISFQLESTSSSFTPVVANAHHSMLVDGGSGGGDEAARQIAFADRIIVNKVDLLQPSHSHNYATNKNVTTNIETVLCQIQSINPSAPIKTAMYSKISDLDWILDINCFDAARVRDIESAFQQSALQSSMVVMQDNLTTISDLKCGNPLCIVDHTLSDSFCGLCNEPSPSLVQHQHTNAVGTIALFRRGSADLHKINTWLASVLWPDQDESDKVVRARLEEDLKNNPSIKSNTTQPTHGKKQNIYRLKGVISIGHALDDTARNVIPGTNDWVDDGLAAGLVSLDDGLDKRRFIVQAVNDLWDILPASQNLHWGANETRCCKIVVIGKWLDEGKLQKGFQDCFLNTEQAVATKK